MRCCKKCGKQMDKVCICQIDSIKIKLVDFELVHTKNVKEFKYGAVTLIRTEYVEYKSVTWSNISKYSAVSGGSEKLEKMYQKMLRKQKFERILK